MPPVNLAFHAVALRKKAWVFVTLDVSQPTGIVLKANVYANIPCMSVTELTSHLDRCWLNAFANMNMSRMVVTLEVSHRDMSALKAKASWNMSCMVVTLEVSHVPIS